MCSLLYSFIRSFHRIDDNIMEATDNMDQSIGLLEKAQKKFQSKRSLIIKIFLAVLVFLLLFGIFLR